MLSGLLSGLFDTLSELDFRRHMPSPKKARERTFENGGGQLTADKTTAKGPRRFAAPLW